MDNIQKFSSDIEKIQKHIRSSNNGSYNGKEACSEICSYIVTSYKDIASLAGSFADYWMNTYINSSVDLDKEPTELNKDKIIAIYSLLAGKSDNTECLSRKELCNLTNYEAEDIPLDLLNDLMSIFVDKHAL